MGWFLYNGNTELKQAYPNHHLFPYIIFSFHGESLFPQVSSLIRHTFNKSIKPRMLTESLANNSHK